MVSVDPTNTIVQWSCAHALDAIRLRLTTQLGVQPMIERVDVLGTKLPG
jgi:hypothetical protein